MPTTVNISWDKYIKDIYKLVDKVKDEGFQTILGVSRGGNIPATIISEKLDLPLSIISASSYEDKKQKKQRELNIAEGISNVGALEDRYKVLIVDDLYDTGNTVLRVIEYLSENFYLKLYSAVIYAKQKLEKIPYVEEYPKDCWIKFPYEGEKK